MEEYASFIRPFQQFIAAEQQKRDVELGHEASFDGVLTNLGQELELSQEVLDWPAIDQHRSRRYLQFLQSAQQLELPVLEYVVGLFGLVVEQDEIAEVIKNLYGGL